MRCDSIGEPCFRTSRVTRGLIGAGIGTALAALFTPRGICTVRQSPGRVLFTSALIVGASALFAANFPQCDNTTRLPAEP
jgi:xanthine/uracil permease